MGERDPALLCRSRIARFCALHCNRLGAGGVLLGTTAWLVHSSAFSARGVAEETRPRLSRLRPEVSSAASRDGRPLEWRNEFGRPFRILTAEVSEEEPSEA